MFRCAEKVVSRISRNKMKKKSRREDSEPSVQENKDCSFQNDKDWPATKCDLSNLDESQLQANKPKKEKFMGFLTNLFHKFLFCCCISGEISDSETYEPEKKLAHSKQEHVLFDKANYYIDKYKITKEIGRGSFGTIYLAKTKYSRKKKALKIVKKKVSSSNQFGEIRRETIVWNCVSAHPNIVRLIRFLQTDTAFCFVSDFVEGETLTEFIQKNGPIAERKAKVFAAQVASAIMYIHRNGIIHRDISSNNIMLDVYKGAQVIDFGLSTYERNPRDFCGTLSFMCPEILQRKPYDSFCDWWAFAIVLFQALVGRTPLEIYVKEAFDIDNVYLLPRYERIRAALNVKVSYPPGLSDDARHFIRDLLQKDPYRRPLEVNIREHEYFHKVPWPKIVCFIFPYRI
ncbi:serine/threonine-protein kinase Aurora-3-like isoform X1 [Centruroides sculpturatus]|uniref:serine/threonine-protein kinase Aurora-3-like isoform X1 n=1 Tax=Centruroides sculpturatus TaxID=218467 RepID=UPI000C6DBF4C|nr:serine/threonine-protein kinase Aurora-3-like isoform X1 [Centruroides sculpturatus]